MITFSQVDSVKERVLQNIVSTLQNIKIIEGFAFDIGAVLRYRIAGYDTLDYPALLVVGNRETKVRRTASPDKSDVTLLVTIEVLATNDSLQDSEEYHDLIMRDVEGALMQDVTRGGMARYTDVTGTSFTVVAQQNPFALSIISVTVTYQHTTSDPTEAR